MLRSPLWLVGLLFVFALDVQAGDSWKADEIAPSASPGILRCFYDRDAGLSVSFQWKANEHFRRVIRYRISSEPYCRAGSSWPAPGKAWDDADLAKGVLEGKVVPATVLSQIRKVAKGANRIDALNANSDFLELAPGEEYTNAMNRDLTARYGAEFSTKTYARWLDRDPRNHALHGQLHSDLVAAADVLAAGKSVAPVATTRKVVFMIALGLAWNNYSDADRPATQVMVTDLFDRSGYPVEYFERDVHGMVEPNGLAMAAAVTKRLAAGEDVVLVGLSKGMPEAFIAGAAAVRDLPKDAAAKGYGRLLGMVSFSGITNGTFLSEVPARYRALHKVIDWASELPFLTDIAHTLDSLSELGYADVSLTLRKYRDLLPKDAVYLDLCGINGEYGLPGPGALEEVTKALSIARKLMTIPAANDGMADYPVLLPRNLASTQYSIGVEGTHYIFDGKLDEVDLKSKYPRDALVKVVFGTFLRLFNEHYAE